MKTARIRSKGPRGYALSRTKRGSALLSAALVAITVTAGLYLEGASRANTAALEITSPAAGQTVPLGSVTFSGTQGGMRNVEIFSGEQMVARATISGANWTAAVDTAAGGEGTRAYSVRAWDSLPGQPFTEHLTRDISVTVSSRAAALIGDLNGDNVVAIGDLSVLLSKWGTSDTGADLNKDGSVSISDLSILLSNWGKTTAPAPVSPAPTNPAPTGVPTTSSKGSFVERACKRTYALSGMQVGTAGDPNANGNRFRGVISSAQPGDCITVAPGHYRLAGLVDFNVPDITLKGLGANREEVVFFHTTEMLATFRVNAGGVHFYNFTHRVPATARSSQGESGQGNIWARGGHSGFRMQDVLAWGSRDAAIFLHGVHNFELNRVESRDSKSDAYHISKGSSHGKWFDSISRNSGDDGLGFVGYGGEGSGTPHHHTVVRHQVLGQSWGRGIGIIHVNNISFHGPTLIEDSAGAGVIMAREQHYGSGNIRAIRFFGELRIRRANHHEGIRNHGAIMIHNDSTSGAIEEVLFEGPVRIVDTGKNMDGGVAQHVKAHGPGRSQAEIRNASFYGTGPATKISLGLAGGSTVATPGWSNATGFSGAEPPFPRP